VRFITLNKKKTIKFLAILIIAVAILYIILTNTGKSYCRSLHKESNYRNRNIVNPSDGMTREEARCIWGGNWWTGLDYVIIKITNN
jgi:hypothetical protein